MNRHPQFEEDFDLYTLGVLEGEEKQALESHLKGCPDCSGKWEAARGRVALLALAAPARVPPRRAKESLLSRVRAELMGAPAPIRRPRARWAVPAFALTSLALAVGLGLTTVRNHKLDRQVTVLQAQLESARIESNRLRRIADLLTAADSVKVTLVAGEARPIPQGKAFYHPRKGLLFYAANLPALPQGRTYQLWLVPTAGLPINAGIFQTDAQGNGEVVLPPLPLETPAKAFAVTVEPAGGVPQPTGPKVLIGLVS